VRALRLWALAEAAALFASVMWIATGSVAALGGVALPVILLLTYVAPGSLARARLD
jgi:hypothetical protein